MLKFTSQKQPKWKQGTIAIATLLAAGSVAQTAKADPVPRPPNPEVKLPPVFCFRFTDIKAVKGDDDKFQFSFEVLNWTDTPAGGVYIALNEGNGSSIKVDSVPVFADAAVDPNGRPIGTGDDGNPTGNLNTPNDWNVTDKSKTAIEWSAGSAIPNSNLLGAKSTAEACGLVPGCELQEDDQIAPPGKWQNICRVWGTCDSNPDPVVADMETVDDGLNVLDGFTVTIDDFDEGEIVSFNWFLQDENGDPIGTSGRGNEYGFGTVNLYRQPIDEDIDPGSLFAGNSGFGTSNTLFYDGVNRVTETINIGPSLMPFTASEPDTIALFSAEFGPGTTANFINPTDNKFDAPVNTVLEPGFTPTEDISTRDVPEPTGIAAIATFTAFFFRRKRR